DIDYQQSMAFVALVHEDGELREVGISRYAACCEEGQCECAVTIADDYQGLGLDAVLMRHLIDVARRNGFRQMYSVDSAANRAMRDLCCALGFVGQRDPDDSTQVIHRLAL
ncbi:GNAT family N-acetyltransferase, partial [Pseudomonas aeruginosa]